MTTIHVHHNYYASATDPVELPDGVEFSDIKGWYVKWCIFHYTTDNETWHEIDMYSDVTVNDYKRPNNVEILADDGNGSPDFTNSLAEGD